MDRKEITQLLQKTLEPRAHVLAMWEMGSRAFGRIDAWSDIDLLLLVQEDSTHASFEIIEKALATLAPIDHKWRVPEPTWHGHSQALYHLENTPEFLVLDLVIIKETADTLFLEMERYGKPTIYFDKTGRVKTKHLDPVSWQKHVEETYRSTVDSFPFYQGIVRKQIARKDTFDAFAFFHKLTLGPIVTLLGLLYRPERFDFGLRYLHSDLPPAVQKKLLNLLFVSNLEDIKIKQKRAETYFEELKFDYENARSSTA